MYVPRLWAPLKAFMFFVLFVVCSSFSFLQCQVEPTRDESEIRIVLAILCQSIFRRPLNSAFS